MIAETQPKFESNLSTKEQEMLLEMRQKIALSEEVLHKFLPMFLAKITNQAEFTEVAELFSQMLNDYLGRNFRLRGVIQINEYNVVGQIVELR
jgi:hypothetical protein